MYLVLIEWVLGEISKKTPMSSDIKQYRKWSNTSFIIFSTVSMIGTSDWPELTEKHSNAESRMEDADLKAG